MDGLGVEAKCSPRIRGKGLNRRRGDGLEGLEKAEQWHFVD